MTASLVLNLVGNGMSVAEIPSEYPYLEEDDIQQDIRYGAWLADEAIFPAEPLAG